MAYDLNNPTRLKAIAIHRLLNLAADAPGEKKHAAYYIVYKAVLLAHKKNQLRDDVRERFEAECPKVGHKQFIALHHRFQTEVMGVKARKMGSSHARRAPAVFEARV